MDGPGDSLDDKGRSDYEGGMADDMMNEVEVKSNKKKRLKKARICGKRLTKGEEEENAEIYKKSMSEINKEFGKQ